MIDCARWDRPARRGSTMSRVHAARRSTTSGEWLLRTRGIAGHRPTRAGWTRRASSTWPGGTCASSGDEGASSMERAAAATTTTATALPVSSAVRAWQLQPLLRRSVLPGPAHPLIRCREPTVPFPAAPPPLSGSAGRGARSSRRSPPITASPSARRYSQLGTAGTCCQARPCPPRSADGHVAADGAL